jgi:hypothetical protein
MNYWKYFLPKLRLFLIFYVEELSDQKKHGYNVIKVLYLK